MTDLFTMLVAVKNEDVLAKYVFVFERAPQLVSTITHKVADKYADDLRALLGRTPGPTGTPARKIEWTSERQKRAYFASDGFGAGIPYPRTGRMVNAWGVEVTDADDARPASIGVINSDPKRAFVTGEHQQRFHALTGWYNENELFSPIQERMATEITERIGDAVTFIEGQS